MRYQKTNQRRAIILMVVLSLLTLFALVGVTFVLYADAEATAARIAREAQTMQVADTKPEQALAFFLGQLIYDVPDTPAGAASGLRGHSLARTMYGYNYVPGPNFLPNIYPYDGVGRLHYPTASGLGYPIATPSVVTPIRNVPNNYGAPLGPIDDYALVNYTWFSGDNFVRDPERLGIRANPAVVQSNAYVGGNAPYTYPDLNSMFLAAMRADGTVLTPSYHRPWLFQVATVNAGGVPTAHFYPFNDMSNPNWTNPQGKYLTLRPRPAEHPLFPPPGDATGDVKNLPWAPGGNDSIWIDLGAPVMTAPDGTRYKPMFAPLVIDLDNRINLNTAGNIMAYIAAMTAPANWQAASQAHVSNQGWGPWEVNLSKVLWAEQGLWAPSALATPPEWMRLLTGMSHVVPTNALPVVMPGVYPYPTPIPNANLSAWLLPGVRGRYFETPPAAGGVPVWTPNTPLASNPPTLPYAMSSVLPAFPYAISMATTYPHIYAQSDYNGWNEASITSPYIPSSRIAPPGFGGVATACYPTFVAGYGNGGVPNGLANPVSAEDTNNPALYNAFQTPMTASIGTRAFRAQDMATLLRPNLYLSGPVDANASAINSDLARLCPLNFSSAGNLASLPPNINLRFRNLVTTQSTDIGAPGVSPYWYSPAVYGTTYIPATQYPGGYTLGSPAGGVPPFPSVTPPSPATATLPSEFGTDWRATSANSSVYVPFSNPLTYPSPGARIRLNRPLPPYPHMGAGVIPPYTAQPPGATLSPYGQSYNLTNPGIANQYTAAVFARQALANDIYRRLLAITGVAPIPPTPAGSTTAPLGTSGNPTNAQLAPFRWLAQLAVNIVDYIDEDDIMTPFNFYTAADSPTFPPVIGAVNGGDDPGTPPAPNATGNNNFTGANPQYWVFGTELPKVVLNEVLAEAQELNTANAAKNGEQVRVWAELYNTMPTMWPAVGTNTQSQDSYRVPLYITIPGGGGYSPYRVSISQYTMDQAAVPLTAPGTTDVAPNNLSDVSQNVLGKAYITAPASPATPLPKSTTDADFSGVVQLSQNLANPQPKAPANQIAFTVPGTNNPINAGVDPGDYFLLGPPQQTPGTPDNNYPNDPFVYSANNPNQSLPSNVPVLQTSSMTYTPNWTANSTTDERSTGLTVTLRRLANPYLPPQLNPALPNYNPYVTVDYIPSVPLMPAANSPNGIYSFGKRQPYAGLLLENGPPTYNPQTNNGKTTYTPSVNFSPNSPVFYQNSTATTQPPPPANAFNIQNGVSNTFGQINYPLPQSGHYDWLVHLDRAPISPMELLHVSAWPPYKLTQRFMLGSDTNATFPVNHTANPTSPNPDYFQTGNWKYMFPVPPNGNMVNMFAHYAPWFDLPTGGNTTLSTQSCPWWFDDGTSGLTNQVGQSHRLYRLFEFLECGDRGFGVNGLGRIPGKVNINTIWDPEVLQALIDANTSLTGIPSGNPPPPYAPVNPATGLPWTPAPDLVSQIFANMMNSRSPNYYGNGAYVATGTQVDVYGLPPIGPVNMGTTTAGLVPPGDDRPFMPLSMGLYTPTTLTAAATAATQAQLAPSQFPNGFSILTDTILRTNNPPETFASTNTYPQPIPPPASATPAANNYLLFQNYNDLASGGLTTPQVHPYLQAQLLTKLYNNVTTRSNVFAVFLTVGYFQVLTDNYGNILPALGQANIPQLGPEIGRSEGKQVRHHMFAIIDRTNLTTFTTTGQGYAAPPLPPGTAVPVTGPTPNALYPATVSVPSAPSPNPTGFQAISLPLTVTGTPPGTPVPQLYVPNLTTGIPGVIQAGTQLVIDAGTATEETVTVIQVFPPPVPQTVPPTPPTLTANFTLPHGAGGTPFPVIQRGNPGPWLLTPYDPRLDTNVVPYFSIID
jgi:hypothetical protein